MLIAGGLLFVGTQTVFVVIVGDGVITYGNGGKLTTLFPSEIPGFRAVTIRLGNGGGVYKVAVGIGVTLYASVSKGLGITCKQVGKITIVGVGGGIVGGIVSNIEGRSHLMLGGKNIAAVIIGIVILVETCVIHRSTGGSVFPFNELTQAIVEIVNVGFCGGAVLCFCDTNTIEPSPCVMLIIFYHSVVMICNIKKPTDKICRLFGIIYSSQVPVVRGKGKTQ